MYTLCSSEAANQPLGGMHYGMPCGYKIMFVDDEEQNLFLMEKVVDWEEMGFRVCGIALDGMEGIQVFKETEPDVVFVDIRMEEMDGLTLIETLQKEHKKAVFVIVTAYDEFSYAKRAISLGVKDYLLKPISRKEMIPMVNEIKKSLDLAQVKEQENLFISKQYENSVFAKAFSKMESNCLKKEPVMEPLELDKVIGNRSLWYFELFSPTEDVASLLKQMEEWDIEYRIPGGDSVYGITPEEKRMDILESFENLRKHNYIKKYILQENSVFCDAQSLTERYRTDFVNRNYCFYQNESCLYSSSDVKSPSVKKYLNYGTEGEAMLRQLIYNASPAESEDLVGKMIQYAQSEGSAPDGLIDQMIELLIFVKSQLTKLYQDRAFMVLRHQNVWELHRIRTAQKLEQKMRRLIRDTAYAVRDILENKGNYSLMGKTTDYVWKHFANPEFSASEVAEEVHLSRNYFLKIFKENMGVAFLDYVTNIRMERAKQLLKRTDETVYSVSKQVGYESQYHFSRKFKNLYGISPNEYRNL